MAVDDVDILTAREMEILSLTGAGHSAQEIADRLSVSRCTVENHKRRIYQKLGVTGQGQAVSRGLTLRLLDRTPGPPPPAPAVPAADGRELVVINAMSEGAAGVVARTMIGCGRALLSTRDPVTADETTDWFGTSRYTTLLVDPQPADWKLPVRLGARAITVTSEPPGPGVVADALARGAYAVIWLEDVPAHLPAILDLVAKEYVVVGANMRRRLWPEPRLTARERDVLISIADGHTIRQTARLLGIASKTVESTRARLFRKLDARNRLEALTNAYRSGLIPPGPVIDPGLLDRRGRMSADPPS